MVAPVRDFCPDVDYLVCMRSVATCVLVVLLGCGGGGSSGQGDGTRPKQDPTPNQPPAANQAATCKALCGAMGRCAGGGDFDTARCAEACGKTKLADKYITAYDACAKRECSELSACMTKVKLGIRQEKTCNLVCDRNNTCAVQSAKKNMTPEKAAKVTEERVLRRNRTECMVECMDKPMTAGQIKGADMCLAKSGCDDYVACLGSR